ncbi:MAG: lipid A deacylase LpxR family protein [Schleiferiaceae bacterium]|nr:lipid A deacylase LpxR family protein [Schleiferiaceae bacterium]
MKKVLGILIILYSINAIGQDRYDRFFRVELSNDFLYVTNPTDRYFSNGTRFVYWDNSLSNFGLSKILIPKRYNENSTFGFELEQNLYTPSNLTSTDPKDFDRPYSSYLLLKYRGVHVDDSNRWKFQSSIAIGVLGELGGGGLVQNFIHSLTPTSHEVIGWSTLHSSLPVVSVNIEFEKGLYARKNLQWLGVAKTELGNLYSNVELGAKLYVGGFSPYFSSPLFLPEKGAWQVVGFAELFGKMQWYNATLNGPYFYNDMPGNISAEQQFLYYYSFGVEATYDRLFLLLKLTNSLNEVKGLDNHVWGTLSLGFRF